MWAVTAPHVRSIGPHTGPTLQGMRIIGPRVITTQIEARDTITT
jgi:hypothetical protein